MYPGNAMASALCSSTATLSRCAPGARPSQQYLRPSRAPATWSWRTPTSWTTTAGDRVLGMALISTRRTPTPKACNRSYAQGRKKTKEPSFDVTSPAEYNNFQQKFVLSMRDMLRDQRTFVDLVDSASGDVVAHVARLPPQVDTPDLMNLTLHAGEERKVTLSVRTDNLYVVGFRNSKGRWFELRHDGGRGPMIQGSTQLRFDGRYDQGGIGELSAGWFEDQDHAILGPGAVVKAINDLSHYDRKCYTNHVPSERDLKRFLRILIVNFIESVKFKTIAVQVATQLSNPSEDDAQRRLDEQQILLIRNWGGLSHNLMHAVNIPDPALREGYLRSFNSGGIDNLVHVDRVLGMALANTASRSSGYNVRPRCAVGAIGGGGLTLAEAVGVVIRNINGKLDGTITVTDGFSPSPLKLYDDHTRLVSYPHRPISGADDFVIDVNLNHKPALVQVAVWNPRDALSGDYNRILNGRVTRKNCDVEVQYAVLTDAVVAMVEVVVMDADVDVDVYGSVTARTTMASGKQLQYSLFDKPTPVLENMATPLQRKLVSAPLCSTLEVSANLWQLPDHETRCHEIANVSVVFTPRLDGTDTAEITGPCGRVRVAVTWFVSLPHE